MHYAIQMRQSYWNYSKHLYKESIWRVFFVLFSFLYCFCVLHSQSCFYNDIIFWAGEAGVYIYEVACAKNGNFQMIKKKKKRPTETSKTELLKLCLLLKLQSECYFLFWIDLRPMRLNSLISHFSIKCEIVHTM